MQNIKPIYLYYLAVIDLAWSGLAIQYDWPRLVEMPPWAIIFTAICPLYPLLLATIFALMLSGRRVPTLLATWAYVGSLGYGILALIFYPIILIQFGWDWWTVGSIFWVLLYAVQSVLVRSQLKKVSPHVLLAILAFFITADILNYHFRSFSYFLLEDISPSSLNLLFASAVITHLLIIASLADYEWLSLFSNKHSSKMKKNR